MNIKNKKEKASILLEIIMIVNQNQNKIVTINVFGIKKVELVIII